MKLTGNAFERFRHNDLEHLRQLLLRQQKRCWIVTEGIFSMDGDPAPLKEIIALAEEFDAMLVVDDAHGFGVVNHGISYSKRVIQIGTFSKAAGSYGGYVCASAEIIEKLVNHARSLIYTTGLPPAVMAANLAALKIIREQSDLVALPLAKAGLFCSKMGLPAPQSAIVPVIIGEEIKALEAAAALEAEGFLVVAIRPPTVPAGTSRLRFTFSAVHKEEDIAKLSHSLRKVMV